SESFLSPTFKRQQEKVNERPADLESSEKLVPQHPTACLPAGGIPRQQYCDVSLFLLTLECRRKLISKDCTILNLSNIKL
ncbi:MAG: hypothetical protein RB294_07285, partial [Bacteroidales bacterium]|nr:hypothetical protein [Bacteroidales bacterium]